MTTSYTNLIECQTEQQRVRLLLEACEARLAAVKAERDTAQAGEARAVEALRRIYEGATRQLAEPRSVLDDDQYALTAIATECEAVSAGQVSALAWLDRREREAAAKENDRWADQWWSNRSELSATDFTDRAAALRANKGADHA